MSTKKRGLGRGLGELLSHSNTVVQEPELRSLPVEWLQKGRYQPREIMEPEALQELAESIKQQGIIQPIVVRAISENRYEIIAGERRWRAAQLAGLQEVPAVIKDVDDQAAVAMALIENIQREQLNPVEEARALQRLIHEFSLTHQQAAVAVGKSRAAVSNFLRLNNLHPDILAKLEKKIIEMGHAKALLGLTEHTAQLEAMRLVESKKLNVRETESLVQHLQQEVVQPKHRRNIDPDIARLQKTLTDSLGAKVLIQHKSSGKGRVVIQYHDLDQLDGILEQFR